MAVHLITGGAGFVGSNLARLLLEAGDAVVALDDLSRGKREFLAPFDSNPLFRFLRCDCSDIGALHAAVDPVHNATPITEVWHMAANSDIPAGIIDPGIDLSRTFMTTFSTLLLMRNLKIPVIRFASSSAVYGDLADLAITENSAPLEPISNYGAMKLASEAQIRAAVESYLARADIFRFPNVVGLPATHGVIIDLVGKARLTPASFDVLGDGTQQKIYLHVEDLVSAMLFIRSAASARYNVYNIGPQDDGVSVREIAELVSANVSPHAEIRFGAGNKGWVGDVPRFRYDTRKLTSLGWSPAMGSRGAVSKAVAQIAAAVSDT